MAARRLGRGRSRDAWFLVWKSRMKVSASAMGGNPGLRCGASSRVFADLTRGDGSTMLHRQRLVRAGFGASGAVILVLGAAASARAAGVSMGNDLVQPPTSPDDAVAGANVTPPHVVYLDYADGSPTPNIAPNACQGTPPELTTSV